MHQKNIPSNEARKQEHVNSTQFYIPFDGTAETCPYKTGDLYELIRNKNTKVIAKLSHLLAV